MGEDEDSLSILTDDLYIIYSLGGCGDYPEVSARKQRLDGIGNVQGCDNSLNSSVRQNRKKRMLHE